jgi:hypothetical protein
MKTKNLNPLDLLSHPNLLIRISAATAAGFIVFLASWGASYAWLPEGFYGILRWQSPPDTGLAMFTWNLMTVGVAAVASFFVVNRFPAGYIVPLLIFGLYGGLLGTNSFAHPDPAGPQVPTLSVIWTRSGLREALAYLLVAAALTNIYLWRQPSWLSTHVERVRSWRDLRLSPAEILLVAVAIALLFWAVFVEASQIAQP